LSAEARKLLNRLGLRRPGLGFYALKSATVTDLEPVRRAGGKRMFLWPYDPTSFYSHYKELLELAGLPYVPH
jgi:hypothetical protein